MALSELLVKNAVKKGIEELGNFNRANRADRITIDLDIARSDMSLGLDKLGFKVIKVGNGVWSFKFVFSDGSTMEVLSSEVRDGELFYLDYTDILFTNTAQPGRIDPDFMFWWYE